MIDPILAGKRILVVEDEILVTMLIEDVLTDNECSIVGPYSNVREALAAAQTSLIDAAILDVNLKGERCIPWRKPSPRERFHFFCCRATAISRYQPIESIGALAPSPSASRSSCAHWRRKFSAFDGNQSLKLRCIIGFQRGQLHNNITIFCRRCGAPSLTELPVIVVIMAMTRWNQIGLYSNCHEGSWDASPEELQQIRKHVDAAGLMGDRGAA